jgi:SAM-dependent methyltransferase
VLDPSIQAHYDLGVEQPRLAHESTLEWVRSREVLERYLPPPPASVLDVGGGPGVYAAWLAGKGYAVRLIDPVPRHIDEARTLAAGSFEAAIGDARRLEAADASFDAVLLMGPLYHLVERADRIQALGEARRVAKPGGCVIAVGISRFASLLDGLRFDWLRDPDFRSIVEADLRSGQHRNPRPEERPEWFTTAFFHRPDELVAEVTESGLDVEAVLGIEGPGWLVRRDVQQAELVEVARAVEQEPSLLGASAHLMLIARRLAT